MEILRKKKPTDAHPYIPELQDLYRQGRVTRREFLRYATLLGMSAAAASAFVAGCGGPTPTPAAPAAPAATAAPQPTAIPQPTAAPVAAGPKRGGTFTIASRVPRIDHPARFSWIEGVNQMRQVCEYLTYTGYDNITVPWLLDRWEANADVNEWTLYLKKGIKFNNGQDFTADDVIFNLQQWLDPDIGSSMLGLMSYLKPTNIEKVDDYTVKLYLDSPQIGVPEHLFHYPAMIVPKTFEGDIIRQPIGTGPYLLEEYIETERCVLKRRTDYYRMGVDGQPLPYIEKLVYLDLGEDPAARTAAIRSGQVDNIFNPNGDEWQAVKDVPNLVVYSAPTAQTFVIRMRVDQPPWNDNRVRQALKKCLERQKMLDLAWFGNGVLAHDTHVAPVHPAYCEKPIPPYDPEGARKLLAEAGYPNGLEVELSSQQARAEPAMAQVLKESAAAGGFNIKLNLMPSSNYWDKWTEVPLGITIWAHRPLDTMVLALAYTADAEGKPVAWNETAWVDEEFTKLLREAERTLDVEKRRAIMCKLEDIQMERGSVGIPFWTSVWYIAHKKIKNVAAHPTNYDILYEAWIDESA